jgi:phosphate transport system substrate-binding protein
MLVRDYGDLYSRLMKLMPPASPSTNLMPGRRHCLLRRTMTTPLRVSALVLGAALLLAGCASKSNDSPMGVTGTLKQAGSSTVFPIAEAWAEELAPSGIQVTVAGGGSGTGASKLCAKEVDLGDLSRKMKDAEVATCKANGVDPVAWTIAYDGLSIVVAKSNTFVDQLTIEELKMIWQTESTVHTWADVREGWPNETIKLYGADSDSGTYEYFNEEVLGKTCGADGKSLCAPRNDYTPAADDNVLVEGVKASAYALGYFGYAYYYENQADLKVVPIVAKGGTTAVAPSFETIRDNSYKPFSRPLFVYTNGVPASDSVAHSYLEYAFAEGQSLVREVGYVELEPATLEAMKAKLGA